MICNFKPVLQKLQKHSAESVESAHSSTDYSKYLHVDRPIQNDVLDLLTREQILPRKSLVLLCGSAGDGKSHMLSHFSAQHEELMDGFDKIINDATESDAPSRTACQTLATELEPFDDFHLDNGQNDKFIVAINEGMLSQFLSSKEGSSFSTLAAYVEETGILKTALSNRGYEHESIFHAVSFSDYRPFTLINGESRTQFLDELFSKVFSMDDSNPFFAARREYCEGCSSKKLCPVCHNYDFLSLPEIQRAVADAIVEVSLAEHYIVTTRSTLNFLYDLIVSPNFDRGSINLSVNKNIALARYIPQTTPYLMYERKWGDSLGSRISRLDVMRMESEGIDELAIQLRTSSETVSKLLNVVNDTPYYECLCDLIKPDALYNIGGEGDLKRVLLRFFVRCAHLSCRLEEICPDLVPSPYLKDYVSLLYSYNTDESSSMKPLHKYLRKAIENWNGDYPSGYSRVASYGNVQILQELDTGFRKPDAVGFEKGSELTKFSPNLIAHAYLRNTGSDAVTFVVNYSLYCLLRRMDEGYQPTILEKNLFTDFATSYERLVGLGAKSREVFIAQRDLGKRPRYKIFYDEDFEEYGMEVID